MANGIFSLIQKGKSFFYLLKEKFAVRSQSNTPGTALKKNSIEILFQLLDRLADSRLTDIKFSGAVRDAACASNRIKNMIKRQIVLHTKTSFPKRDR